VHPVVGGDARCASVAAASVLAKVVRDRLMRAESEHFPAYAFEQNKGYPSPVHQMALRGYGLSSIHRRSWSYVGALPWHGNGATTVETLRELGGHSGEPDGGG
jgi:ribonuclease HII